MINTLRQHLGPIGRRITLLVGRGILRLIDDASAVQRVQAEYLRGEVRDGMERMQDYGLTSVPHPGMEAVAVFLGGDRSNGVVIRANDRSYRLRGLTTGEVALYDDLDQTVHLTRTGITVQTPLDVTLIAGKTLRIEARDIELHAAHSLSWDVDGYGRRVTSQGSGAYLDTTWQTGAEVTAQPLPINPPEGP